MGSATETETPLEIAFQDLSQELEVSGFEIPFVTLPSSRSYLSEPDLCSSDSEDLAEVLNRCLRKGAIWHAESEDQFLSPYFLIDKSSGKRFILNLKELNKYIEAPHFKLKDIKLACQLLFPGTYMASIDLEEAYLLVLIEVFRENFCVSHFVIHYSNLRHFLLA